jgi:hypothetical protein
LIHGLTKRGDSLEAEQERVLQKMRGLILGFSVTRSVAVAAELGIADKLSGGARMAAELARECGVRERPLFRILRALAGEGVFAEDEQGRFGLTPLGELLRSDQPHSLRDWALYMADFPYRAQLEMMHSLKTGEPVFAKVFGAPHLPTPLGESRVGRCLLPVDVQHRCCACQRHGTGIRLLQDEQIVDVGGAHGAMVSAIAKRYPNLRCIYFDLQTAEQGARKCSATRESLIGATSSQGVSSITCHRAPIVTSSLLSFITGMTNDAFRSCGAAVAELRIRASS